jgi:hypothetical protein
MTSGIYKAVILTIISLQINGLKNDLYYYHNKSETENRNSK